MPLNTDPYRPLFGSLAERKAASLAEKYEEKKQALDPVSAAVEESTFDPNVDYLSQGSDTSNIIDVAQSSAVQSLGSLADAVKYGSNQAFGTDFNDRAEDGWSSEAVADEITGVTPEVRAEGAQHQQDVITSLAGGNWLDAGISAVKASPYTAADSAGTLLDVIGGTALTAASGGLLGPVIAGKKIKDVTETAKNIKDSYDEATRLGKVMKKAKNLPAASAKLAGQGSLLAADLTMQTREDYMKANNQQEPSGERMAVGFLSNMATSMFQPLIMAKLFVPKFKDEIAKELATAGKNLGKGSNLFNIVKRMASGVKKVTAAGAAEGAQEYVQTWQQGLVANLSPEQVDDFWNSVAEYTGDDKNQIEATASMLMGAGAGGVIRGATAAPAVAAGTALDLTKATGKGVYKTGKVAAKVGGKIAQKQAVKAADRFYSPEERADARAEYKNRKEAVDIKKEELEAKALKVQGAQSYDDMIADDDIRDAVLKAQKDLGLDSQDLKNHRKLKRLKNKLISNNRASQALLDAKLKGSTLGKVISTIGTNVKDDTVQLAKDIADTDQVKKMIEQTKKVADVSSAVIKDSVVALREIRSSAAIGIVDLAMDGTEKSTKKALEMAKDVEYSDLSKAATAVEAHNPTLAKELKRIVKQKRKIKVITGLKTDDLINKDTISPAIKEIRKAGDIAPNRAVGYVSELRNSLKGKVENKKTLAQIKEAVEIYENSDVHKNQSRGSLSNVDLDILKGKIASQEKRLKRTPTLDNIAEATQSAAEAIRPISKKVRKKVFKASVKAQRALRNVQKSETLAETQKRVQAAMDSIGETADNLEQKLEEKLQEYEDKQNAKEAKPAVEKNPKDENLIKLKSVIGPNADINIAINNIGQVVKAIKAAGYVTSEDLQELVETHPEFGQHTEFYAKLAEQFEPAAKIETKATPARNVVINEEDISDPELDQKPDDGFLMTVFKTALGCKI